MLITSNNLKAIALSTFSSIEYLNVTNERKYVAVHQ